MKSRTTRNAIPWGVAAIILAATLLFAAWPLLSGATGKRIIDTAAPIQLEQCAPCHYDISDVRVKGLIFSHGNHLLVSCEGCHFRMPHRSDVTERVPMEACFACHRVKHGVQGELASGKCADCHTHPDKLRPVSHGITWAKKPHAEVANASGVNRCMMCHEAIRDCDACHAKQAPKVANMPLVYHPMVLAPDKGPSVRIDPTGPVSMSQCAFCHGRIDEASGKRIIFAHADHIERNYRCEACHPRFPHTALGIDRPDMLSCYRCHGLNHNSHGRVATEECTACHPTSFELMPYDHTKKFIKGAHSEPSKETPEYCAMCHKMDFCIECHNGRSKSRYAPPGMVVPVPHTDARWMGQHGKDFLDGKGLCGVCHSGPSCQRCHLTIVPHPEGFIEDHRPAKGVTSHDCAVCHRDRSACQQCHHGSVKNDYLVRENCIGCHEEAKRIPATDIKHKAMAEHAVHFDVAETKGKPYRCYECHIDFGTSEAARQIERQQGHDMRLCYDCHGALDPFNETIAPYGGGSLCLRCHKDMDI